MRSPNPESAERYTLYSDSPSSRYEKPKRTYHPRKLRSERSEVADDRSVYSASTAADEYKNRHAQELPTPRSARPGRSPSVIPALPVEESSEKGRWVDLLMAIIIVVLGAARFASAFTGPSATFVRPDALQTIVGAVFIVVGFFIAAPELTRFTCLKCVWATRSAMFDRGILFIVAGASNASIPWGPQHQTQVPSIILGGILAVAGITYIVLAAKYYSRFHTVLPVLPVFSPVTPPPVYAKKEMVASPRFPEAYYK